MRGFRIKPNLKNIDLVALKADQVEYLCTTQHIDKKRCEAAGVPWDQEMADFLEEKTKFYFIVKTNLEYNIYPDVLLDPVIEKLGLVTLPITDKAKKCINHYINTLK